MKFIIKYLFDFINLLIDFINYIFNFNFNLSYLPRFNKETILNKNEYKELVVPINNELNNFILNELNKKLNNI